MLFQIIKPSKANASTAHSIKLWHEHTGYINVQLLKEYSDKGIIDKFFYEAFKCNIHKAQHCSYLVGFLDADFVGDLDARRSTTKCIFKLCKGAITMCNTMRKLSASIYTTES